MGLHQARHNKKFGLPELIAILLAGFVVLAATWWWESNTIPSHREADGILTRAETHLEHYNAADLRLKTSVDYEYHAEGRMFTGHWEGFWPEVGDPNALTEDRFSEIVKGMHVVVQYDLFDPSRSTIHPLAEGLPSLPAVLALTACIAALAYCLFGYPALRKRF